MAASRPSPCPPEQRQHDRLDRPVYGRFMLDDALEHRCRAIDLSPAGAALIAPTRGEVGQRVVCYLDEFGRLEGRVVRQFDGGFAFAFQATDAKRQRLARQIAWQAGQPRPAARGTVPAAERIAPPAARAVLHLADGRRASVQIVDLTLSGASLVCPLPLAPGDRVTLGRHPARVCRTARTLMALLFDDTLDKETLCAGLQTPPPHLDHRR